jgi:hypothetical protein
MAASYVIDFTVGWSFGEPQHSLPVSSLRRRDEATPGVS